MRDELYIDNLKKLGLSEPESKVYLNLLKKKNFTATEISRISGTPRSKIYEILNKLINKGLCVEILGSVKKYSPSNPKIAFTGLLQTFQQDHQQELENKRILTSNLIETLLPFFNSQKENGSPLDYIQVIREKGSIMRKYHSLVDKAEYEMLALVKGPYIMDMLNPPDYFEEFITSKKDVKFRTVYEAKELVDTKYLDAIKAIICVNEEIRVIDKIPFKMYVFDEKIAMFTLEDNVNLKPGLTSMIVEHNDLAKGLKDIFNLYWKNAISIEDYKINLGKKMIDIENGNQ